jgi:hypothetical protein
LSDGRRRHSASEVAVRLTRVGIAVLAAAYAVGCSSKTPADDAASAGVGNGANSSAGADSSAGANSSVGGSTGDSGSRGIEIPASGTGGTGPTVVTMIPVPDGGKPAPAATTDLPLASAPALGEVHYVANRSSVRLYLPGVAGARDYRVFAVEDGVKVNVGEMNREHVAGADLYCAGLRQRNQCTDDEILPVAYNNPLLDMPKCQKYKLDRRPNVPTQLMQTMEIDGIKSNTTLVVEAIDRQCPFPGLFGTKHLDVKIANVDIGPAMASAVVSGKPYTLQLLPATFPVRTEDEIRADYGSMILNGQGPNQPVLDPKAAGFPESPYIRVAQPAPADDPVVLARSVVSVSPLGTAKLPEGFTDQDFFDDFEDDADQPVLLRTTDPANKILGQGTPFNTYLNKKWVLYDISNEFSDFSINRGHLNMVFGDPYQDSMSLQAIYPRARPAQLPTAADKYLHITYETQRDETTRRYENLALCGADKVGQTYDGDTLAAAPLPRPGFMNEEGTHPTNTLGWNCLTLVGRGQGYGPVPGGDIASHSDTSLKITVVRSHPAPAAGKYDDASLDQFTTAFGPTQEGPFPLRWERQIDSAGKPSGVWLDDQTHVFQKARFDVFVRRDRLVIYVEGQQRICQNLDPSSMTMAEAAVGFWHVLYHTSAEFTEMRAGEESANPQTAQHHLLHNTPFADWRGYDNVGIREDIPLPAGFDASRCFAAGTK